MSTHRYELFALNGQNIGHIQDVAPLQAIEHEGETTITGSFERALFYWKPDDLRRMFKKGVVLKDIYIGDGMPRILYTATIDGISDEHLVETGALDNSLIDGHTTFRVVSYDGEPIEIKEYVTILEMGSVEDAGV